MDTNSEFQSAIAKQKIGAPVSPREVAAVYANDERSLLQFLADNDFVQVYGLIHHSDAPMTIGKGASFVPDRKRVEGELLSMFVKKDYAHLNDILDNFRINTAAGNITSNAKVLEALNDIKAISMTPTGYRFNLQIS